eukprot:TRINITY_DN1676_c0_g1_i1.p4 TRINITY_DN1676_c0_g1~~TRINITY_DN1676_c0_g1_i1.p4  ORF type:complete len:166 (-),score=7.93 TRINITY_DN1676_c0_g1_i1:878-1375(-)
MSLIALLVVGTLFSVSQQQPDLVQDLELFFRVDFLQVGCGDSLILDLDAMINQLLGCPRCTKLFSLEECNGGSSATSFRVSDRGFSREGLQLLYNTLILLPECILSQLDMVGQISFSLIEDSSGALHQPKHSYLSVCDDYFLEELDYEFSSYIGEPASEEIMRDI